MSHLHCVALTLPNNICKMSPGGMSKGCYCTACNGRLIGFNEGFCEIHLYDGV